MKVVSRSYRYGFNGQEKDDEIKGTGNSLDFTFRVYDSRLGKFLSVDPIGKNYPHSSPYAFAENSPIQCIDLEGLEKYKVTGRSFIPFATVPNPQYIPYINEGMPNFAGDIRTSYQLNSTAFRTEQIVNVDFDNKSVSCSSNIVSKTHGLNKAGKVIDASEAGTAGPVPTFDKPALQIGNSTTIHMSINAQNKLVPGSPEINYQFDITITPSSDKKTFDYQISGATDGFPAYEFWITDETNNKSFLIMNYSPIQTGDNSIALFPPMEYKYNLKGNSKNQTPATVVPFSNTQNSTQCDDDCK
jgi:RHS repeat-associated protein